MVLEGVSEGSAPRKSRHKSAVFFFVFVTFSFLYFASRPSIRTGQLPPFFLTLSNCLAGWDGVITVNAWLVGWAAGWLDGLNGWTDGRLAFCLFVSHIVSSPHRLEVRGWLGWMGVHACHMFIDILMRLLSRLALVNWRCLADY